MDTGHGAVFRAGLVAVTAAAVVGCGSLSTNDPGAEGSPSPSASARRSPTEAAVDLTGAVGWQPVVWHKPSPAPVPPGPDCQASQLRVRGVEDGGAASGNLAFVVSVVNTSGTRCILSGRPGISAVGRSGRQDLQLGASPYIPGPPGQRPANLQPGAVAEALIDIFVRCEDSPYDRWREARLVVDGGQLAFPTGHRLDGCGLSISPWTTPQQDPPDVSALHVHLELPATAGSGTDLIFVARLDARGGDVHLDPCPAFWMVRMTYGSKENYWKSRPLALPCPKSVMHDGESLRFVMQAPMPVVSESTTIYLRWILDWPDLGGEEPSAEATIDVVPS